METELWENDSGRSPVDDFTWDQPPKARAKILWVIVFFEEKGLDLLFTDFLTKLQGYKLFELKILYGGVYYRIFLVIVDDIAWLLHAFKKKTDHTPPKEIKVALGRARQLLDKNKQLQKIL